MIDRAFAENFATTWIEAWNRHDLATILAHYADDFEFSSPKIIKLMDEPSGVLTGKTAVGAYWTKGLSLRPDLHFELLTVLGGVDSLTLYYRGLDEHLCAEVFEFGAEAKVSRSAAYIAY